MWDNRGTADFIKSLFRQYRKEGESTHICFFVHIYIQTNRQTPPVIYVAEPSAATPTVDEGDSQVPGGEDEERDISEEGYDGDYSSFDEEDLFALSHDGSLETLLDEDEAAQEEEKEPAVPTWCIIS
ncbi:hypothetical protein CCMSSC00406_0009822 [Pleurotus cornucopiae]|uniref:Uncharacterized protein n=1 Tax=Pleurotus cornucopiae TaxID=5321 RepID=A0ACB7IUR2_PLECO|nr:hypothetical protein CCMSSC00406_0009822 [Pleurotus cornucopiae]